MIVEADGARRMPCKVPAAHDPVIVPLWTTTGYVVYMVWMPSDKKDL